MKIMRIMQVLPSLNSGGVERCVLEISNFLIENGHEVFVVSNGGWMKMLFNKNCHHINRKIGSKNPFHIVRNAKFIRELCEKHKIDVVNVHSRAPAWACYLAWKRLNFKLVTTFHGVHSTKGLFKKLYNSVMLKSDVVIAVSDFLKNHIIQEYRCKESLIHVIPRGINSDIFSPKKVTSQRTAQLAEKLQILYDKFVITIPARITELKGHKYIIEALGMINIDNYMCLFVGDWENKKRYKSTLEKKIKALKLETKVRFVGSIQDMPALYLLSDLVILPSIQPESFGKVIIEAGAMGCVILSTNLGAPKNNITDGVNGFLMNPKNTVEISSKILKIMQSGLHKDAAYKMKVSEYFIKNFDIQKTCEAEMKIYEKVLGK